MSCCKVFVVFVFSFIVVIIDVSGQQSPCPHVFEYKTDGFEYYGEIVLPSVGRGRTNLVVQLTVEDTLSQDNTGELLLQNNVNSLYQTIDSGGLLFYKVVFPISQHIPEVKSIKLNKQEYCRNSPVSNSGIESTITIIHSFQTDVNQLQGIPVPGPIQRPINNEKNSESVPRPRPRPIEKIPIHPQTENNRQPLEDVTEVTNHYSHLNPSSWLTQLPSSQSCGFRNEPHDGTVPVPTIINGKPVDPGEYPWLVALYQQPMTYICGGTLVSNKHVISAAHCANTRTLYVELGRYHLDDKNEQGVIFRVTKDIILHPDYKPRTGHADIAILILTESVSFNDKIRPICLWSFGKGGIGLTGTITGWGKDLSGDITPSPMQTDVDIVDTNICLQSHEKFAEITSDKTFCAGGKGKGPCLGDSGSGFYLSKNDRWYLRGVISISLGSKYTCDVHKYAVYADIASFLDWLRMYLT